MCPPKLFFFLCDTARSFLPPLPVPNSSQLSVEIKLTVMNIPSRPKFNSDLAILPDLEWELYVFSHCDFRQK
jgi:hypothetical protein